MKLFENKYYAAIALIASGILTSLPLIFPSVGFIQWLSIIPAALVLIASGENKGIKYKKTYGRGLIYFWSYYALSLHWFAYMYPMDFAGLSNAASIGVILIAIFGLSFLQAFFSAFIFPLYAFCVRSEAVRKRNIIKPFIAAALFVLAEWFQTRGWWGVPWARLPIGQSGFILMLRSASLFGSYFISFVIVAVNFCIAFAIVKRNICKMLVALAVAVFVLNLALGSVVTLFYKEEGNEITVAAAQGNISSSDKWSLSTVDDIKLVYRRLTEGAAMNGADVVVWPETALPYDVMGSESLTEYLSDLARDNDVTILVSAFTEDGESGGLRNSMIEVRPDGSYGASVYSKQRLVPFGEYVPMRSLVTVLFPPLADVNMLESDLIPGDECTVIDTDIGAIGCGICFDSIYEEYMLGSVRGGAQVIAISTNDSWFGDSAALNMHNTQARIRAIETGRYVVRSANTGMSSVIDPMGNVKEELGADMRGYVLSNVTLRESRTLYSCIGNLFVIVCAAFIFSALLADVYYKLKIKNLNNS